MLTVFPSSTDLPITQGRLIDFPTDAIGCMRQLWRRHGSVAALQEGPAMLVFVFDPALNQQILTDTRRFHARFVAIRGPKNSSQRRLTCGILSMNGEEHRRHRRLVAGPFQKQSILSYHAGLVAQAEQLASQWKAGQFLDLDQEMNRYMLRVTSNLLFGFDHPELAYAIGRATERWTNLNHEVGIGAIVSETSASEGYFSLLQQAKELEGLYRQMLELKRQDPSPGNDVLSLLCQGQDEANQRVTDDEIIGHAAALFGAAHLTTANSLTWTLLLLAQHPEVAHALVAELRGELHGQAPEWSQLERLPLLDRVIKESMRVLPASGYSQRVTTEPVQLGPLPVPTNTVVIFSQFMTHHLPALFSEPERFRPERWLSINPHPYAFMPFSNGPRHCLGAYLAQMVLRITLPVLLQRFCVRMVPGAVINARIISTMLGPTQEVPVQIFPPEADFQTQPLAGNIHELVDLPIADVSSQAA